MYPEDQARILRNSTEVEKKKEIEEEREEERARLAIVLKENLHHQEESTEELYLASLNAPEHHKN